MTGRAILAADVVPVDNIGEDSEIAPPARCDPELLGIPMLRDGRPIGVIAVGRPRSGLSDKQIALLKTFADSGGHRHRERAPVQGAGAPERDLTEALEQQTATSEILRVISSSPTDVQPVFDAIAEQRGPTV